MRHPTDAALCRLVDEPAGVPAADRSHVPDCATCQGTLTVMRADAAAVGAALATDPADVDVSAAWQRLTAATGGARPEAVVPHRPHRLRALVRRPAAGAVAVALVLGGAGAAAANDWLPIFRTEKVVPVSISASDLVALPDLSAYGDVAVTGAPDVHAVADAAQAAAQTGLAVPEVTTLPRGVRGAASYQVGNQVTATFTFSAARAARAAEAAGKPLPPPPAGLDGSKVRLVAGPGVAVTWRSGSGLPGLLVARVKAPQAFSSGVPFETVRDYVLSLPGLPDRVARQLRAFAADGSTLPLPVPVEQATSSTAQVGDRPATVLTARDRTLAAVVWVEDGAVTVVAGALDRDEVLTIARALR